MTTIDEKMETECKNIKPCVFCSFELCVFIRVQYETGYVYCAKCKAHGPLRKTAKAAIREWNRPYRQIVRLSKERWKEIIL